MTELFTSKHFEVETFELAGRPEASSAAAATCSRCCREAFEGIGQIGVIGWGSQGPAQAQNLRDSLAGTGIKVKVGLREGSSSLPGGREAGFTEENGTLGEMFDVIGDSDIVLLLISDAAQAEHSRRSSPPSSPARRSGCRTASCSAHLKNVGAKFPDEHQRHRRLPEGHGAVGAGGCTSRAPRSTAPASTPASPSTRTSPAGRPTTPSAGRSRSARPTPSRRRWSRSTSRTSSASAASCSARCTASSRSCTAATASRA